MRPSTWLGRLPTVTWSHSALVEGGPWSTRVATRYHTEQDGRLVYRGVYFGRIVWGKVVEEIILPTRRRFRLPSHKRSTPRPIERRRRRIPLQRL